MLKKRKDKEKTDALEKICNEITEENKFNWKRRKVLEREKISSDIKSELKEGRTIIKIGEKRNRNGGERSQLD